MQFHAGQEVEVNGEDVDMPRWEKAKIIMETLPGTYKVQFPDDSRGVFDAEHIRVASPLRVGFDKCGSMVIEP